MEKPRTLRRGFSPFPPIKNDTGQTKYRQVLLSAFKYLGGQKLSGPVYSGLDEWEVVGFLFDGDYVEAFEDARFDGGS
jgi:hypothetical protein